MSSFRVCPTDNPGVTRMEFDYYHMETGDKFEEYFKFVRQVAMEDYELCEKAQENLEKGIYSEGILNPVKESGVACKCRLKAMCPASLIFAVYQQRVLDMVLAQYDDEICPHPVETHEPVPDKLTTTTQLVDPTSS